MPTYEYHCDGCEHHFDEFQAMSEEPLKRCPKCKKNKLRRIFGTGAAILFKGSGFYQTDYRSDSYKQAAKAEQDSGKPAGKSDDSSKSGDKPAATSTTDGASGAKSTEPAKPAGKKGKSKE